MQSLLSGARKPESVSNHLEKAPGQGKEEEDTFTWALYYWLLSATGETFILKGIIWIPWTEFECIKLNE